MENHRQKLSKELEGYRAGYTQCLNESNIKFSWLHQEQAIAIKETFASLSRLQLSLGEFTSPIQTLSKDPEEQSAFYQNKYDKVVSDYSSAMDSWFPRRLFFIFKEIDMNPEIEKLMTKCKKTLIDYKKAIKTRESEQYDKAEESFQDFKTILEKLQKRFADILN